MYNSGVTLYIIRTFVKGVNVMLETELKKLGRRELLELLMEQTKENADLKKKLEETSAALNNKEIAIDNAGSIAEAALEVNGVFETAQQACQQYLDNIQRLSERQEKISADLEEKSREEAKRLVGEANEKAERIEEETKRKCEEMLNNAKEETQKYWTDVYERLEQFRSTRDELNDLLALVNKK